MGVFYEYAAISDRHKIGYEQGQYCEEDFTSNSIAGKTLYSLISSGTEVFGCYDNPLNWNYPLRTGYSAVFEVEKVGSDVSSFKPGDRAFFWGNHSSYQLCQENEAVKIPNDLASETALFSRMATVSIATIEKTTIKPGARVLVTGLGAVGLLAMQVYKNFGFETYGIDPYEPRVLLANKMGIKNVFTSCPENLKKTFSLALECSGSQQATVSCLELIKNGGEISLVGVPWKKTGDIDAFLPLNLAFYNFATVYSGWEVGIPDPLRIHHHKMAVEWLAEGKMTVEGMYEIRAREQIAQVYDEIYNKTTKSISTILKW
ncbi:MAG: hypothetical protein DBX47_05205 [Clostridiales bacterium]|nr:MAG: hypothetical protein DBX47_05205 [Clostridiales bacterium]